MNDTDPSVKRGWIKVLMKGKEFLFLVRHPPCYSYSSLVSDRGKNKSM
jgi:hypothetical protein